MCSRYTEATDAMASKIFPEATTVAEAKAMIVESQRENTKALLEQVTNEALVDALAAICDAPLPESIIEETGRQMYSEKMVGMVESRACWSRGLRGHDAQGARGLGVTTHGLG